MAGTETQVEKSDSTRDVKTSLNYLLRGDRKPVTYAFTPPPGTEQSTRRPDPER